jgi:hypothetical protein
VLAGRDLVVAGLDRDPEVLEVVDRAPAEVRALVQRRQVEVGAVVERARRQVLAREEEELDLGADLRGPAQVGDLGQDALQRVARVGRERGAVGLAHRAEHPPDHAVAPRQQRERRRVRVGDDVALAAARGALEAGAVQADPVLQRLLQLGGRDGQRLEDAEDVDEPEADEAHAALLDRAQHVCIPGTHADRRRWQRGAPSTSAPGSELVRPRVESPSSSRNKPVAGGKRSALMVTGACPASRPCAPTAEPAAACRSRSATAACARWRAIRATRSTAGGPAASRWSSARPCTPPTGRPSRCCARRATCRSPRRRGTTRWATSPRGCGRSWRSRGRRRSRSTSRASC